MYSFLKQDYCLESIELGFNTGFFFAWGGENDLVGMATTVVENLFLYWSSNNPLGRT